MRRTLLVLSALALALTAACAPTAAPAWTYAPPTPAPSVNPSASAGASGAPSAAPSAVASQAASAAPSGGTSGGASTVQISALNIAFEQPTVTAPANAPFTIHFDNKDAGIPHNVEIKDASGMTMFKGDIITGPAQADYSVPALPAGAYTFLCIVHPNMTGTLTVGP
jgi:plastocyanin